MLPQSVEVASSDVIVTRRPRSLPPRRVTKTTRQRTMGEKLKALAADDEKKGEVLTFSPGPSQVVSAQMKKMIDEVIRQRVDEEMKKLGKNSKDEVATSVMKAVSRKLFTSPEEGDEGEDDADDSTDDEATQFRKRVQKTFEADQLRKQDEALRNKRKDWIDEQRRVKKLQDKIQRLEREKQRIPQVQLFSQGEEDFSKEQEKDELHAWYEKRFEGDSKSSGSKDKDDELSARDAEDFDAESRKNDGYCIEGNLKPFK